MTDTDDEGRVAVSWVLVVVVVVDTEAPHLDRVPSVPSVPSVSSVPGVCTVLSLHYHNGDVIAPPHCQLSVFRDTQRSAAHHEI